MKDSGGRPTYILDGFHVDAQHRVLSHADGEAIPLAPKVFDTLLYFVEHPGELLDKRTLLDAIWPSVVVEENNLNQAVSALRRVLGEHPGEHRFIVTEPGRGYRFVATVTRLDAEPALAEREAPMQSRPSSRSRKLNYVLGGLATAVVVATAALWALNRDSAPEWARDEVIRQIERHIDAGDWEGAYSLAKEVRQRLPEDPDLAELWPQFSRTVAITSDPPGARVFRKPYEATADEWEELGIAPLDAARVPMGLSRFRLEREGYRSLLRLEFVWWESAGYSEQPQRFPPFKLDTRETLADGKVRVPGWQEEVQGAPARFADFFLNRYEVTNREYKDFVDAGGYSRPEYWQHPIVNDGQEISWADAMALFTDKTGRPGPAVWEAGDYPEGKDDYPVQGVSWYEAMAYAQFRGEELPTVYHWRRAAFRQEIAGFLVPASNVRSDGPARVGQFEGVSWDGTYDMAGNVREWTFNTFGGGRVILGGGWNDPSHLVTNTYYAQPPLDRSQTNGFRLAITHDDPEAIEAAREDLRLSTPPDYRLPQTISDEVLEIYKGIYAYDPAPLEAQIEGSIETRSWTRERITFTAPYGNERMTLYLYLPRRASPPYQTVVFVPGTNAWIVPGSNWWSPPFDQFPFAADFIVRDGRAVAFPILKGSFERRDEIGIGWEQWETRKGGDRLIQVMQDLSRSLDYLETRRDIDATAFAYFSTSFGGTFAPITLVLEPRWRAAAFAVGGFGFRNWKFRPEVDPGLYLSRVDRPVLMMNGAMDSIVPLETHARPFFERLGTTDKKFVIEPAAHFVSPTTLFRETLDWLDAHLGPATK
ncbi:MAG TPA: SUMF1/EgtB/PvdO family nonheme iron enzyme [Gammaproteobacteria bacterium]|nr:SUMF1/EgtB/PvdO family nonheme iron enzyme [Gammaproteobacteria bacterium]